MDISLELLLELLQSVEWLEASCPSVSVPFEKALISDVALLPTGSAKLEKNILWCGFLSNILTMDNSLREGRSFLALGTDSEFDAISRKKDCNCIFLPQRIGLPPVFNEAAAIIKRLNVWEYQMDLAIARRDSIQKLVDISESIMKNPIVIWNNSFEIQAYSRNRNIDRPQLQKVLKTGHFSGEDMDIIAKMNYLKDSDHYSTLTMVYPPNWMNCPFALRVFMEGQKSIVSMVQYFLNSSPMLGQLELLHLFEVKFEFYVGSVLKTGQRNKTYVYEPLLVDLLDGHITRKEDILDRMRTINIPFEAKYRLYQIRFEKFTAALASYARNNCKSIFPYSKLVLHHESLFLLDRENCNSTKSTTEEYQKENLSSLMEICSAFCGISNIVPDLTYVRTAFLQTESVLHARELMDQSRRVWRFQEDFFWDMVDCYSKERGIRSALLYYRPLEILIENDRATGNDNLRLLDIYLNCDRNITNTAKVMNLHRNSVIYRLERIEQMLNGSLNDPDLRFNLLVSLKILQFIGRKQNETG